LAAVAVPVVALLCQGKDALYAARGVWGVCSDVTIPRPFLVFKTWGSLPPHFVLAERSERVNEILLYKYM